MNDRSVEKGLFSSAFVNCVQIVQTILYYFLFYASGFQLAYETVWKGGNFPYRLLLVRVAREVRVEESFYKRLVKSVFHLGV